MVIAGEAADVDEAIVVVARTRPDVVLLDVHLPGGNGNGGSDVITGSGGVDNRVWPAGALSRVVGLRMRQKT